MADETSLCWVKYNFLKISQHRKDYVKKCEQCDGNDFQCRAYIAQSYFNKSRESLSKQKGF